MLKENYEFVCMGLYVFVCYLIYIGCLIVLVGVVLIGGEWCGVIGVLFVFVLFVYKVCVEESWLIGYFGLVYMQYCCEVVVLIFGFY